MSRAGELRASLATGPVVAPGCTDAVSAKLVRGAGFAACYLSGAAVAAVELGEPDIGHVGLGDMLSVLRKVARAGQLPVIVDSDTGYGGLAQVRRTAQELERADAAAIQIEDQLEPKRCASLGPVAVVDLETATARVAVTVDATAEAVVIARTDALAGHGLAEVTARVEAFLAAGADLCFVSGATLDQLEVIRSSLARPCTFVLNCSESVGRTELPDDRELVRSGVGLVIVPVSALLAAAAAVASTYAAIRDRRSVRDIARTGWDEFNDLLGLPDAVTREQRWTGVSQEEMHR